MTDHRATSDPLADSSSMPRAAFAPLANSYAMSRATFAPLAPSPGVTSSRAISAPLALSHGMTASPGAAAAMVALSSPMTAPARTASLYLRLSVEADDTSTGLASQEADLRALAAREGLTIVAVHKDDGWSGSLRNRPGLQAWLADARDGRVDHLLAWKVDRITRGGVAALAEVLDLVRGDGAPARLLTCGGEDSRSSAFGLQVAVMAEVAYAEREAIRARIIRARKARDEAGRWNGGHVPYGFQAVPAENGAGKVLAVEPVEAEALREAARRIVSGEPARRVARWLSEHAPAGHQGAKGWSRTTLVQTLQHDRMRQILDHATRRAVAKALEPRKSAEGRSAYGAVKAARLLSGLLRCEGCGGPLYVGTRYPTRGVPAAIYRCDGPNANRCAAPVCVSGRQVEEAVEAAWLMGWSTVPETRAVRIADRHADALAEAEEAVEAARSALATTAAVDLLDAVAAVQAAEAERDRLAAEPSSALSVLESTGRTYGDVWEAGTVEDRREILARTVGTLTIGKGQPGRRVWDPSRIRNAYALDPAHEADAVALPMRLSAVQATATAVEVAS